MRIKQFLTPVSLLATFLSGPAFAGPEEETAPLSEIPGLFMAEESLTARQAALARLPQHGDGALRWRAVRIDHSAFNYHITKDGAARHSEDGPIVLGTLKLNLFKNEDLIVKNQYVDEKSDGAFNWVGEIVDSCDGCGLVFLSVEANGAVSGSIRSKGDLYKIAPTDVRESFHVIFQVNPQTLEPFNDATDDDLPPNLEPPGPTSPATPVAGSTKRRPR